MQPIKILTQWLLDNADAHHYLFASIDLRILFPTLSDSAFKTLLSRAVTSGLLVRVCRGIYLYERAMRYDGLLLFHVAALLRRGQFNYISLETALSDVGVISQIPINWITIMSSGRSSVISCAPFGTVEFVKTTKRPEVLADQLVYDPQCGLWRAHVPLALRDLRRVGRNTDLIDEEVVREFMPNTPPLRKTHKK